MTAQAVPEEKNQSSLSGSTKRTDQPASSGQSQSGKSDAKRTVDTTGNKSSIKARYIIDLRDNKITTFKDGAN